MCPASMPKQPGESVVLPSLYSGLEISLSVSTLLASRVVSWKIRKNGGANGRGGEDRRERGDGDRGSCGKQWAASARLLAISLHRERECVERESRGAMVSLVRGKRKEEEEEVCLSLSLSVSLEGVGSKGEEETKGRWCVGWIEGWREGGDHRRRRLERSRA